MVYIKMIVISILVSTSFLHALTYNEKIELEGMCVKKIRKLDDFMQHPGHVMAMSLYVLTQKQGIKHEKFWIDYDSEVKQKALLLSVGIIGNLKDELDEKCSNETHWRDASSRQHNSINNFGKVFALAIGISKKVPSRIDHAMMQLRNRFITDGSLDDEWKLKDNQKGQKVDRYSEEWKCLQGMDDYTYTLDFNEFVVSSDKYKAVADLNKIDRLNHKMDYGKLEKFRARAERACSAQMPEKLIQKEIRIKNVVEKQKDGIINKNYINNKTKKNNIMKRYDTDKTAVKKNTESIDHVGHNTLKKIKTYNEFPIEKYTCKIGDRDLSFFIVEKKMFMNEGYGEVIGYLQGNEFVFGRGTGSIKVISNSHGDIIKVIRDNNVETSISTSCYKFR